MLVLFSMALFVVPFANDAQAQRGGTPTAGNNVTFCHDSTGNTAASVKFVTNTIDCGLLTPYTWPASNKGMCLVNKAAPYRAEPVDLDVNGNPVVVGDKCVLASNKLPYANYVPFPNTVINPPKDPGTGTGTATGTGTKPTNTGGGTGTGTGGSSSNQTPCDPPEAGFHKAGPLCVPNNPFSDSSIAGGNQTAASLAVRIIKILLYFAAIVAVIMIIIGGYYVMTAAGNETQAATGRKTLTNAIIGLVIVILAYVIVQAVVTFITK